MLFPARRKSKENKYMTDCTGGSFVQQTPDRAHTHTKHLLTFYYNLRNNDIANGID